MIRECTPTDFEDIWQIINDAAVAYRGVIPADCWHEPYMSRADLSRERAAGVWFWGLEDAGALAAVMGLQYVADVALIRHAYTRTTLQGRGLGATLLAHLRTLTDRPMLVGTWRAATWAIRFYERHEFHLVPEADTPALLRRYWTVPERQIAASVVLSEVEKVRIGN